MITSEYSLWFILLCLTLAGLYSFFFYRKDRQFFETKKWKIYLLAAFRFFSIFVISFLLIAPMLKLITEDIEKPILVIASDNTESLINNSDSSFIKKELHNQLNNRLINPLSKDFEIINYTFGEKVMQSDSLSFSEKETNISNLLEEISVRYENRNLGAIVVVSDGIYNKGKNPIYSINNLKTPIYSIALGDTSVKKDAFISSLKANKIAFLGNKFPVRIQIAANRLEGLETNLRISHSGKILFEKKIKINESDFTETIDAEIIADKKGLQQFLVTHSPLKEELITKNNNKSFVIDVLDNKQKILLLANSPHPDLGAIRSVLEKQLTYNTDYKLITDKNINLKSYDLVVLHQIPSLKDKATSVLGTLKKENIPSLFILGAQSDLNALNTFNSDTKLNIKQHKRTFEESSSAVNKGFKLFEMSHELQKFIENSAPLYTHFADYKIPTESEILFYQKMKGINTDKPLIFFTKTNDEQQKSAYILGEGIWRWRLADYNMNENHNYFDEIIGKIVQYLALKVKKERFIIKTERIFTENQHVKFEAQVYNESFEAISNADINLELKDDKNIVYKYTLNSPDNENDKTYYLNAGILPLGEYTYNASAKIEQETLKKTGTFLVVPLDIETANLRANHKVLQQLADKNGGKLFYKSNLDSLAIEIENNNSIAPIYHSNEELLSLINFKVLFFLILALLTAEWFLRKFYGSI